MARGEGVTDTAEEIDRGQRGARACAPSRVRPAETVALLEENGARLEALLRALSDEELDRAAPFGPAGGRALPTGDLAAVAARHTREHLAHAKDVAGDVADRSARAARSAQPSVGVQGGPHLVGRVRPRRPGVSMRTWCTVPLKGAGGV